MLQYSILLLLFFAGAEFTLYEASGSRCVTMELSESAGELRIVQRETSTSTATVGVFDLCLFVSSVTVVVVERIVLTPHHLPAGFVCGQMVIQLMASVDIALLAVDNNL